uniref:interleukin-1 receptor-associated kinase 1-like n=1 Tax=Pristiophorus japonicus TaxID=55135 RepID=UPI00398F55A7
MSGPGPGAHYVYELPARVMCDFYRVMDSLGGADWARFASCIVTDMTELRLLENRGEPGRTENVVWHLINRNGTVGQLLDILTSLGLWRARDIILSSSVATLSPQGLQQSEEKA